MSAISSHLNADLTFHSIVNNSPHRFTREQIEEYNRQGFIAGITLFEGVELEAMQEFFARYKAAVTAASGDGGFQSFHHQTPELYDIVTQPWLVEHLQDLLGPNVVCFVSQYVCKEPGDEREVVWHQDASFNPMDARSVVVWLAVDDAFIENGCMWFIPGSHLKGLLEFDSRNGHEVEDAERQGQTHSHRIESGTGRFLFRLAAAFVAAQPLTNAPAWRFHDDLRRRRNRH